MLLILLTTIILAIPICFLLSRFYGTGGLWMLPIIVIIMLIVTTLYIVLKIASRWKLFTKMGEEGWKSIIPIYGSYVLYKHIWNPVWYLIYVLCLVLIRTYNHFGSDTSLVLGGIIMVIELLYFVISVMSMYKLSIAFGHGIGYALGLYLINPVFQMILAFGNSEYQETVEDDSEYQEIIEDDFFDSDS